MKRFIAIVLSALMIISLAACSAADAPDSPASEGLVLGGWEKSGSPEVTEDAEAALETATAELLGAEYEPVALLGRQLVAGTNYLMLCTIKPVTPDAAAKYAIVTVYADLDGGAKVTEIYNSDASAIFARDLSGGWNAPESFEVTKEHKKLFDKAAESLDRDDINPVVFLGSQVVAGVNYCFLCEMRTVASESDVGYCIVYIYEDIERNAEITEVVSFTADNAE